MPVAQMDRMLAKWGRPMTLREWVETGGFDTYGDPTYQSPTETSIKGLEQERTDGAEMLRMTSGEDALIDGSIYLSDTDAPTVTDGVRNPEIITEDGRTYVVMGMGGQQTGGRTLLCRKHRPSP